MLHLPARNTFCYEQTRVLTIFVDLLQAHYICLWLQDLIQQQLLSKRPKQRLLRHLWTVVSPFKSYGGVGTTPYKVCTYPYEVAVLSEPISKYIPLQYFQRCSKLWCLIRAPQALRLRVHMRTDRERLQPCRAASSCHHTLASCYIHCPRVINNSHRYSQVPDFPLCLHACRRTCILRRAHDPDASTSANCVACDLMI